MLLLKHSTAVLCAVFIIITGAVSGEEVKKAVGETVSFRPDKLGSPVTSITWKQINGVMVVKVIEWDVDEDGFSTPNSRFKGITTLDEKTGQITITNLKVEHSGIYTIDINSKEQEQRFSLTVMERVPKPVIIIEKSSNPDVAYLRCNYSEIIIWKNSAGDTLEGKKNHNPGEFIKVNTTRTPGNFYTCTLKNDVSEETSDQVNERKIFGTERVPKPVITIEKSNDPDVVYLRCGYSGTIIWKNSAGDTLKGTKNHNPGEFITVTNTRNPEHFYTCTLRNAVNEETSDQVNERKIFVTEPVPKPVITIEKGSNPDVAYLRCEYDEIIIWKNSAGDTLKGMKNHNPGEFITVTNTRNPEHFYTCTLKNAVSEETSDQVNERKIFGTESNPGLIAGIVIGVLLLIIAIILSYLLVNPVHAYVNTICSCIPNLFGPLDCLLKKEGEPKDSPLNDVDSEPLKMTTNTSTSDEEPQ